MKILTVADESCKALWEYGTREKLKEYDLILCAGDLSYRYLEHLADFTCVPVLFVHGNHDKAEEIYQPGGCTCIDDSIYTYKGYRILGLGGSIKYNKNAPFQYTERQMEKRILKLRWKLFRSKGFDILLTHAPAAGCNDGPDFAHRGFQCFVALLEKFKPAYFIHGHVHLRYDVKLPRCDTFGETTVINAFERFVLDVPDKE